MTSGSDSRPPLMPRAPTLEISQRTLKILAPLPATAAQLLRLLADPNVSLRKIADVAIHDVGLSAALLRCANSAAFGMRRAIGSISEAIRVIGISQTRLLVLASGVSQAAQRELPLYGLPAGTFMRHSELVASLTMSIARMAGYGNIGLAYSTGLLHDIGKVLLNGMALQSGQPVVSLEQTMREYACSLLDAELALFGGDHTQVAKQLAELWSLPDDLTSAVAQHHQPLKEGEERSFTGCLVLANGVAGLIDPSYPRLTQASDIRIPGWIDREGIVETASHEGYKQVKLDAAS